MMLLLLLKGEKKKTGRTLGTGSVSAVAELEERSWPTLSLTLNHARRTPPPPFTLCSRTQEQTPSSVLDTTMAAFAAAMDLTAGASSSALAVNENGGLQYSDAGVGDGRLALFNKL
eukprot:13640-Heterococcus_DN1.PRE.1